MSPYQTHQPLLFACAREAIESGGEVIELGSGFHSTPQLQALLGSAFRSYETDSKWSASLRGLGVNITDVASYDDVPVKPYAMVFIDNAPEERRKIDLLRFRDSRLIVVHDSNPQYANIYGLETSLALYPYRYDYLLMSPNTTVVSCYNGAIEKIRAAFR
jgi:hypothetical protein